MASSPVKPSKQLVHSQAFNEEEYVAVAQLRNVDMPQEGHMQVLLPFPSSTGVTKQSGIPGHGVGQPRVATAVPVKPSTQLVHWQAFNEEE